MLRALTLPATVLLTALTLTGCATTSSQPDQNYSTSTSQQGSDAPLGPPVPTPTAGLADAADYTVSADLGTAPTITVDPAAGNVSALFTRDIVTGSGDTVTATDSVTVHYTGIAATTGIQFDTSWDSGAPVTFALTGVIRGWTEGLIGMKEGGRRLLVIPADYAYGQTPPTPDILPGETLIFVVDLITIVK